MRHILLSSVVFLAGFGLAACGGGSSGGSSGGSVGGGQGSSPPPPPPPPAQTKIDSTEEASRFINVAAFGDDKADLDRLVNQNAESWVRQQMNMTHQPYLRQTLDRLAAMNGEGPQNSAHNIVFWKRMISNDDQLRHRMTYALSQIIVVSDRTISNTKAMAYYMDILGENAFGNYKDILMDITYSPAMSDYLTYRNNKKADPETGRMPDENYAREILQLFTIGLNELSMDGTEKLDGSGNPIPTFTNDDIGGLARVFTGLVLDNSAAEEWNDRFMFPLTLEERDHSELEKTFLGGTIAPNTPAAASIEQAIDIIFEHPNVAPFISRQLIQRFTASNPEPAYVQRVAEAFETGRFTGPDGTSFGSTGRGDLEATLAAILLDESQFDNSHENPGSGDLTDIGKVREPVLNFVHWARAFDVSPVSTEIEGKLFWGTAEDLGQAPFGSLSVFNFYRPGFVPGGTMAGEQGLTVPEMQLVSATARNNYIEFMTDFIMDRTYTISDNENVVSFKPDYSELIRLWNDVPAMIDHLDELLTFGRMTDATKTNITDLMAEIEVRSDTTENAEDDKLLRAELAVLLVVTSPEYMTQQ
jgi:uncharacterized protein (DUF1800 family)